MLIIKLKKIDRLIIMISCKYQIKVFTNKPPFIVNLTKMITINFKIIILISIILRLPNNKLIRRIIIMKLNILYMKLLIKGWQKDKLKARLVYFQARIIC